MNTWGIRTTRDFLELIQATMPPGGPPLAPDRFLAIVVYILRQNGAAAGAQPLAAATAVAIGAVATGQRPAALAQAGGGAAGRGRGAGPDPAAAAAAAGRGAAPQTARGLTVRGFLLIKHRQDLAQRILVVRVQMKVVAAVRYEWL